MAQNCGFLDYTCPKARRLADFTENIPSLLRMKLAFQVFISESIRFKTDIGAEMTLLADCILEALGLGIQHLPESLY